MGGYRDLLLLWLPKLTLHVCSLVSSTATYQSGVVCLYFQSLSALHVQVPVWEPRLLPPLVPTICPPSPLCTCCSRKMRTQEDLTWLDALAQKWHRQPNASSYKSFHSQLMGLFFICLEGQEIHTWLKTLEICLSWDSEQNLTQWFPHNCHCIPR